MRSIRVRGTPNFFANAPALIPRGLRYNSSRTSPGCIGARISAMSIVPSVVIYNLDFNRCIQSSQQGTCSSKQVRRESSGSLNAGDFSGPLTPETLYHVMILPSRSSPSPFGKKERFTRRPDRPETHPRPRRAEKGTVTCPPPGHRHRIAVGAGVVNPRVRSTGGLTVPPPDSRWGAPTAWRKRGDRKVLPPGRDLDGVLIP